MNHCAQCSSPLTDSSLPCYACGSFGIEAESSELTLSSYLKAIESLLASPKHLLKNISARPSYMQTTIHILFTAIFITLLHSIALNELAIPYPIQKRLSDLDLSYRIVHLFAPIFNLLSFFIQILFSTLTLWLLLKLIKKRETLPRVYRVTALAATPMLLSFIQPLQPLLLLWSLFIVQRAFFKQGSSLIIIASIFIMAVVAGSLFSQSFIYSSDCSSFFNSLSIA